MNIATGLSLLYWAKKKRMEDVQQQLAALRPQLARMDRKSANAPPAPRPPQRPDGQFIEELLSGELAVGALWRTRRGRSVGILAIHARKLLAQGCELLLNVLH